MSVTKLTSGEVDALAQSYQDDTNSHGFAWTKQHTAYADAWECYSDEIFEQTAENQPDVPLFPLRVNTVKLAVHMHAFFLWGQYQRRRMVSFAVQPKRYNVAAELARAEAMEDFFHTLLRVNRAAALLREQSRLYMVYGGIYLRLRYNKASPVDLSLAGMAAEYCYPVWDPLDYNRVLRLHIKIPISYAAAKMRYGFRGPDPGACTYRETWEGDSYVAWINDQVARDAQGNPYAGTLNLIDPITEERCMPWVYIPRIRTGRFYGQSLVSDLSGLMEEYNLRLADTGDAVNESAHPSVWGHDITRNKAKGPLKLEPGKIFDAGDTPPGGTEPFIETLPAPNLTQGTIGFGAALHDLGRELAQLSPVMFGQDEGSQRSGETLAMRAIPTTSLIDEYRTTVSDGLLELLNIAQVMCWCARNGGAVGLNGVDLSWFGHEIETVYGPVIPKDRAAIVQEVMALYEAEKPLISQKRALELLPDVVDAERERNEIEADIQREAARKLKEQRAQQELALEGERVRAELAAEQEGPEDEPAESAAATRKE